MGSCRVDCGLNFVTQKSISVTVVQFDEMSFVGVSHQQFSVVLGLGDKPIYTVVADDILWLRHIP